MEGFRYQALDTAGRSVSGTLQAETPRDARTQLRARGLLPSFIQKNALRPWARGLSAAQLSLLTRQMATLLDSGLTMEQALAALIEEAEGPATRELLAGVKAEVMAGASLAVALGSYARSFPEFYRALVQGGEDSGALPTVLAHLAAYKLGAIAVPLAALFGSDALREQRQDIGIDSIRLGKLPRGLREIAHLPRIHDDDRQPDGGERRDAQQLVPTGGLEHDQLRRLHPKPLHERPNAALIVGHRPAFAARPRRHHQLRFRDINPD